MTKKVKDESEPKDVFPKYLLVGKDSTIECVGYLDDDSRVKAYSKNKGYILNDTVWIYSDIGRAKNNRYPYFWINDNGEIEFSKPTKQVLAMFSVKKLNSLNLTIMTNSLDKNEELYDIRVVNDMNSSGEKYIPTMSDRDDFLKKLIKTCIINKAINLNRLKHRVGQKYVLPNMKAALDNSTKMSVSYYNMWTELLGLDYVVVIYDNGSDEINPLPDPLVFSSKCDDVILLEESVETFMTSLSKNLKKRGENK